ncbi:MAG: hypothetical protein JNL05_04205 [Flavobacteriales bacterium]|nr:hypothetical protein [Flavobacteriales bacterium]
MSRRVRASALFYAITVSLLVAMVTGSSLLLAHHRSVETERWLALLRATSNAESAIHLALATEGPLPPALDLFGEGRDTVQLTSLPYGLFDRVIALARQGARSARKEALVGLPSQAGPVLVLTAHNGPLHFCGDARIMGDAVVPGKDLRRGYIAGRPFSGERFVNGAVSGEGTPAYALDRDLRERAGALCAMLPDPREVPWQGERMAPGAVITPQDERLPVLQWTAGRVLTGSFRGPLVIRSVDTLVVDRSARLSNVIVQAPFVDLSGAQCLQVFSTGGVRVRQDARLLHPSVLCVASARSAQGVPLVQVDSGAVLQGGVLALRTPGSMTGPELRAARGALIQGEVYCEGAVDVQGAVEGRVIGEQAVVHTSSSVHRGYLLDGTLAPDSASAGLSFIRSTNAHPVILQWEGSVQH